MQLTWRVPWSELGHEKQVSLLQPWQGAWEGGEEVWGKGASSCGHSKSTRQPVAGRTVTVKSLTVVKTVLGSVFNSCKYIVFLNGNI